MLRRYGLQLLISFLIVWFVMSIVPTVPPGRLECMGECQVQLEECVNVARGEKPFSHLPRATP